MNAKKYYIAKIVSEDAADFPHIEQWVWDELRKMYPDIDDPCKDYETAEVLLSLLRGESITAIGYFGHGFQGWDGRILEC